MVNSSFGSETNYSVLVRRKQVQEAICKYGFKQFKLGEP